MNQQVQDKVEAFMKALANLHEAGRRLEQADRMRQVAQDVHTSANHDYEQASRDMHAAMERATAPKDASNPEPEGEPFDKLNKEGPPAQA